MFVSAFICYQPVPFVNILDLASTTSIYIFICLSVHLGLFYLSFLLLQIHPLPLPEEAPDGVENLEPIPIILIIVLLLLIVLLIIIVLASKHVMLLRTRHVFLFLIHIHKNHVHIYVSVGANIFYSITEISGPNLLLQGDVYVMSIF